MEEHAAAAGAKPEPVQAAPTPTQRFGLRGGLAALRERANIQDKLIEK